MVCLKRNFYRVEFGSFPSRCIESEVINKSCRHYQLYLLPFVWFSFNDVLNQDNFLLGFLHVNFNLLIFFAIVFAFDPIWSNIIWPSSADRYLSAF